MSAEQIYWVIVGTIGAAGAAAIGFCAWRRAVARYYPEVMEEDDTT